LQKPLEVKTTPFRGGCNTYLEPALLDFGKFSMVQNFRQMHPGLKKRPGQIKLHDTADGTNRVMSLYQFSKGKKTERHLYAQMSDGDVLEATSGPPTVMTAAVFGAEVHDGTSTGMLPASWSVVNDTLLYSNGVDQHQVCFGTASYVNKFIVYKGAAAIPDVPILGEDYSSQVTDGQSSTVAILDSLGDLAVDYDCVFIMTPAPIKQLTWTLGASTKGNTTAAVGQMKYRKTDNTWAAVAAFNDGTELLTLDVAPATPWLAGETVTGQSSTKAALIVAVTSTLTYQISGRTGAFTLNEVLTNGSVTADQGAAHPQVATLGYTGNMTWTTPTDSMPSYMFGAYGYWYQFSLASGDLDAEVEVTSVTFEANWTNLANLWDGVLLECIEAQFNDVSAGTYITYGGSSITLSSGVGTDGSEDFLYIASSDPIDGMYIDVGDTPSTVGSNKIDTISYWNGATWTAWAETTNYVDSTTGFNSSGYIVFPRRTDEQKLMFNKTQYYANWYKVTWKVTLSASVNVGFQFIPKYSIDDFGKGVCNTTWKERAIYTFDQDPEYIYIAPKEGPQTLNGDDFSIMMAGDGRANKIRCMKSFYNELMVFQEEKGEAGGCITLFDGYNISTFGRLILSTRYGTMNAQSVEIIDGFVFGENNTVGMVAFILSRYGILFSDGKSVKHVPGFDDIANYFDPSHASCIRFGYENHMWLKYDSAFNILRIGLVTGSGTVCNTFLTYDLKDQQFSFDSLQQPLACALEVEAASGSIPVLQVGGGTADGFVYLLNNGLNDVATAIDSYATLELDGDGDILQIDEIMMRLKVQSAGNVTVTPYLNSIAGTAITLAQTAETATQTIRRHKEPLNLTSQHISFKIQHNTVSESCYLEDYRFKIRNIVEQ
jgi:hypothetical protein